MRISARTIALWGAVALALANLGRIPAGALAGRNAPVTLADLVVGVVWLALFLALLTGRARIVMDQVMTAATMFVVTAAVSTALAMQRYGFSFEVLAFLARWVLYFGWYPFVAWCLTDEESRAASRYADAALFFICAFGIVQSLFLPEFASLLPQIGDMPAWEYQGRRLVSTLLDPNFAGGMALLAVLPPLARVAEGQKANPWTLVVPVVAIALSASRSSVLALGVGLGVIVFARGFRPALLKTLGIGVLITLPAIPALIAFGESMHKFSVDASAGQRLVTWKRAFTLFMEHPVLGIGFNATRQAQIAHGWRFIGGGDTGFDGGLLFVMVMTGVVGVLLYSMLLGRGVLAARRAWKDPSVDPDDRAHATATAASVIALLVHSLFSNSLLLPFVMQVLWVRFGRLAHISAERRSRLGLVAALPLVLVASSCSPCAGATLCNTDYAIPLQGSIRSHVTGSPVTNARIDVAVKGADGVHRQSLRTDATGTWSARFPANCCDDYIVEIVVAAPGQPAWIAPSFHARGNNIAGDAYVLEPWLDRPTSQFSMRLVTTDQQPLANATAKFTPTDGVPAVDEGSDAGADPTGVVHFALVADRVGEVIGTLTVNHPLLTKTWSLAGMVVPLEYRYRLPRQITIEIYGQPGLPPIVAGSR